MMTQTERREFDRVLSRRSLFVGSGNVRVPEDWKRRAAFIRSERSERRRLGLPVRDLFEMTVDEALEFWAPMAGGASFFEVTLDTTGPASPTFAIGGGATFITSVSTTADFTTADSPTTGYQVKIWGTGIDKSFNASIQDTEVASEWIAFSASIAIKVSSGDGSKTVKAKIRDDVWNETAELSDSVTLDTTVPVATVSSGPDVSKVSKISGKRTVSFEFQADVAIQAWKVKVVPATNSIHSAGTTILTTNGSTNMTGAALAATTNKACTIDGRDLEVASSGDGKKIIKVFVQDEAGNWSTA